MLYRDIVYKCQETLNTFIPAFKRNRTSEVHKEKSAMSKEKKKKL